MTTAAVLLALALGALIGFSGACWALCERTYLRRVEGNIDAWAVHAAAERTVRAVLGTVGADKREAVELAVRAIVVIGRPHAFIPGKPWREGTSQMCLSRDLRRVWVFSDRQGLEARVARAVAEIAYHALHGKAPDDSGALWVRTAMEWAR